ncbi:MAG: zinc-binding dehydrogenase [Chloroflexi bacterium]|nr:zinc-binding dehydrogenase [Chloroflexota bacterium]
MKAAVLEGKRRFVIQDVPEPVPEKDEVLIKVQYCGICGSDLHVFKEGAAVGFGHEYSGDVVKLGSAVKGWKIGERVAIEPSVACGECFWCKRGDLGLCEQYYIELVQYKGAFATYAKARHYILHRLPKEMSYEEGAIIEPTTCAVHAIKVAGIQKGDVIAVLGLGPIGQLVARVARASGAGAVYASEISPQRLDMARGAVDEVIDAKTTNPVERILELTKGRGPDVVFECAGAVATTQQSVALVRKGGTIVIVAICFETVELPVSNINLRGLTIKGSMCFSPGEYAAALKLIKNRAIDVSPLLTVKMPLDKINEAFEMAARGEGGKILIKP